jgi:hypothetical protein
MRAYGQVSSVAGITASVGKGGENRANDVSAVQQDLARHVAWLDTKPAPPVTGKMDDATLKAIVEFQKNAAVLLTQDGVVSPGFFTIKQLDRPSIPKPSHRIFAQPPAGHTPGALTASDYAAAAKTLGCETAAIQAVAQTETQSSPWDDLGRPSILYERHVFSALTHGAYNASHPDIANTVRGGYGRDSAQYPKLWRAAVLDEHAALQSASWGAFQIVGRYFAEAGFASVEDFVTAMMTSEQRQLDAFVGYINASPSAKKALQAKDWAKFAAAYNGPAYADNSYDTKMAAAYARLAPPPAPPSAAPSK